MAAKIRPWIVLCFLSVLISSAIPLSSCQSSSPQNIETFYPLWLPPIIPTLNFPNNESIPPSPTLPLSPPAQSPSESSSKKAVAKAVVVTAASTLVISGLFFFLLQSYVCRRRMKNGANSHGGDRVVRDEFRRFNGNIKGVIVNDDGLDVIYCRKLEGENLKNNFNKDILHDSKDDEEEEKEKGDKSSTTHDPIWTEVEDGNQIILKAVEQQDSSIQATGRSPPPTPPPPPPIPAKKSKAPPSPPPPKADSLASSSKPPPALKGIPSDSKQEHSSTGEGLTENGNGQVKLKPLHWDKVNPNVDHSMVWHKIDDGSFRFDADLMEALFGYVATNPKSPQRNNNSPGPNGGRSSPRSQIFILDARKSQNTAIVLRSLAISHNEIIDALMESQGLNADTLEKLTKIAPTKEEESNILAFEGDPTRLADAESFLYHLLKAVPSAFTFFNAMLFRSDYDSEILHLKEFIQTLKMGCKELRTCGLFLKLLEAILKAGNRMNAGTSRGNAQAFNLTALRKLSDVKSIDGKTTLLHFVMEEIVRSEGKRCVINRNRSLSRNSSRSSNSSKMNSDNSISEEEKENEYIMLGLPVVGGLSVGFCNLKKAATIDYEAFAQMCSGLTARAAEIRQLLAKCAVSGGGFVREMKGFLEAAEEELRVVKEEQTKVMALVKRTTEYYQPGASKDKGANPLQLFVIVKDFLGMVDQVCIDIARNLQKRKTATASVKSSSAKSPASRISVKFPKLPANFMSDKSKSTSSDSDDDF
ncbi:hypothetical protein F0562_033393 [Nyssa sinensis]|uniref:Formin-like protein n=1 Tax=Nyssa sinensis TaxID=561372 RepID=A0A5J5AS44_9ASTE|nr:hypothetical protein F0562_033393 [Nyssa sinensis]